MATAEVAQGQQAHNDMESKVNDQYDTEASMLFYKFIMGGGGEDIHYGIFHTGDEDLKQCSQNTTDHLCDLAASCTDLAAGMGTEFKVLDLGSGKGGASRFLATKYGCHVTSFNLGARQNEYNKSLANEQGIGPLIDTVQGSFNDPLPGDWSGKFNMVWSQEALCHAVDQKAVIAEVARVLKPGGCLVFTDIMQGDTGGDVTSFTGQNVSMELASPSIYREACTAAGLTCEHKDMTKHLSMYFKLMSEVVTAHRSEMEAGGVGKDRLDAYEVDLQTRQGKVDNGEFAWGSFLCKKPAA